MYTTINYQSKKALIADLKAGKEITYFQPGGMFEAPLNGTFTLEGPHYPKPHRWYAQATAKDGKIISVK